MVISLTVPADLLLILHQLFEDMEETQISLEPPQSSNRSLP